MIFPFLQLVNLVMEMLTGIHFVVALYDLRMVKGMKIFR